MVGQLAPNRGARDATEGYEAEGRTFDDGSGQHDWAALYRAYRPLVYRHCRRRLATSVAAHDATQQIFTNLIARASQVPPGEGTARWMQRVAANHCLNELRDEKRRRATLTADEPSDVAHDQIALHDLVGHLLAGMPEHLRLVAWLRHACDLELQEIATMLHVSPRTVVTRLSTFSARARRVLLTQLHAERHDCRMRP